MVGQDMSQKLTEQKLHETYSSVMMETTGYSEMLPGCTPSHGRRWQCFSTKIVLKQR
jgi:hypothetical protein